MLPVSFHSSFPSLHLFLLQFLSQAVKGSARGSRSLSREGRGQKGGGEVVERVLLYQLCGIFPKMHIVSIQIGDVFIGVHRELLRERRALG